MDNIVKALTEPIAAGEGKKEPEPRDIVFRGSMDEVQEFFHKNQWTDGLPVIPPTISATIKIASPIRLF